MPISGGYSLSICVYSGLERSYLQPIFYVMNVNSFLLSMILFLCAICVQNAFAQSNGDRTPSLPLYFEFDEATETATLRWIPDPDATQYEVYLNETIAGSTPTALGNFPGGESSAIINGLERGQRYELIVQKRVDGNVVGQGNILVGIESELIHWRGRCLLVVESGIADSLSFEIDRWRADVLGDGWWTDTIHVNQDDSVTAVKARIAEWHEESYPQSQSLFLLGHVPVPYSGNIGPDGHNDHIGAWPADVYYGELEGFWSDNSTNNSSARRAANRNVPGDGKFDQSFLTSDMDLEVGRVDFSNLPAFPENEIELTRQYMDKNHAFRLKEFDLPRRAIIENNFASFPEGFGQNGWNNFVPFFGPDQVAYGNYDEVLKNEGYLCSYACGAGSYRSAGGIGTTANLFVPHDLETVFTMNFGSYFGDWDTQDNFLRAALGSGKILVNAWAGRPNWHFFHMAQGLHVGFSAALTQYNFIYPSGFGGRMIHAGLMGDPTLRLHMVAPVKNLQANSQDGVVELNWSESADASLGYAIYRKSETEENYQLLTNELDTTLFSDACLEANTEYSYLVKAIHLESSASGSYFNSSTGMEVRASVLTSNLPSADFAIDQNWEQISLNNNSLQSDQYFWDFGDGATSTEENPQHSYSTSGMYTVCVQSGNGICAADTLCQNIVVAYSLPDSLQSVVNNPACFDSSDGSIVVTPVNGDSLLLYRWNTGDTDNEINGLPAGEYELEIESSTGLTATYNYTLMAPDSLTVEVLTTASSGMDGTAEATVTGGTPPFEFDWGDGTLDPDALPPGTFTLLVTDANGCTKQVEFTVDQISSNAESNAWEKISLYPNPVQDRLFIKADWQIHVEALMDVTGHRWPVVTGSEAGTQFSMTINNLPPGVYLLRLVNEHGQNGFLRFVKQ